MSHTHHPGPADNGHVGFQAVQSTEQFRELRRTHRSFVFPMAVVFLVWYFVYVLLAAFASDFMAIPVWGNINVGILLGLLQFVSTFVITGLYVMFTNRRLDPKSTAIREELESIEPELAHPAPEQADPDQVDASARHDDISDIENNSTEGGTR